MSTEPATTPAAALPRRLWGGAWRLVLALSVGMTAFALAHGVEPELGAGGSTGGWIALDMLFGVFLLVLYPLRHRFPMPVSLAIGAMSGFSALGAGLAMMAVISLATRRRVGEIGVVSAVFVASALTAEQIVFPGSQDPWWLMLVIMMVGTGVLILIGLYLGGRRQLLVTLREQAAGSLREQRAQLDAARANERTRIAREMHDVLAHRLSLVALHAGALEYRSDLGPGRTRDAAGVIRENAHLALGELREVLGLLRTESIGSAVEVSLPQPSLADLGRLLDENRGAGTVVGLSLPVELEADPVLLPEATGRHLYRIIQEALTNARRHAPGAPVSVTLGVRPVGRVTVRVENPLVSAAGSEVAGRRSMAPPSGLGLEGLAERAELAGGKLEAGPDADDRFVLEAWLPWKN
ncbi:sensor histidine kinase [Paeniglutamicibacter cryotolerans]|uniref:histidine kinase n=1 Tax=Paeniglutamicibacter cryotolerans TaxID=670079 RepID=A0A839QH17_9MICC|nr:histidine kinase [Paeniglutamicibacter cryotolerans]MBB2994893.1 signal transduction histidine kinase [Paeniglutamicibacter cryotolerans]